MHGILPIAREILIVSLWLYKPCGSKRNFGTERIDFRRTKKLVFKKKKKNNFILSPMVFWTGSGLTKLLILLQVLKNLSIKWPS